MVGTSTNVLYPTPHFSILHKMQSLNLGVHNNREAGGMTGG